MDAVAQKKTGLQPGFALRGKADSLASIRRSLLMLISIFLISSVHASNFSIENDKEFYRDILIGPDLEPGIGFIVLDEALYEGCKGNLNSIRILDANETIKPYAIRRSMSHREILDVPVSIIQNVSNDTMQTQIEIDAGEVSALHNLVIIHTEVKNFLRRVWIEGSSDLNEWWILRNDSLIFDFSAETSHRFMEIAYPDSHYRYLRLTIEGDPAGKIDVSKIDLHRVITHNRRDEMLHGARILHSEILKNPDRTKILLDLGFEGYNHSSVEFQLQAENFRHIVNIFSGNKSNLLTISGKGSIYRYSKDSSKVESLVLDYPELSTRYMAFEIMADEGIPAEIQHIVIRHPAEYLYMDVREDETFQIFYGSDPSEAPHYDFEKIFPELQPKPRQELQFGAVNRNPEYAAPLTDRIHRLDGPLAWTISSLGAVLLLGIAARRIRKSK